MTLTNIVNEKGETVIGVLTEKTRDKIVLIVHGEQGSFSFILMRLFCFLTLPKQGIKIVFIKKV